MGTRGSASAEYFLDKSYAVVFLYRKRSLKPFERQLNNVNVLDVLAPDADKPGDYRINSSLLKDNFDSIYAKYHSVMAEQRLLEVDFISLFDYFALLEFICRRLGSFGKRALIYLAAAVSDFYIPKSEMSLHKIQSNVAGLTLELKPVPKMVGHLKGTWCPDAYLVTFKLETDTELLLNKCKQALEKYKHHAVIGNILEDRKNNVILVQSNSSVIEINLERQKSLTTHNEIEELIVEYLQNLHSNYELNKQNNP